MRASRAQQGGASLTTGSSGRRDGERPDARCGGRELRGIAHSGLLRSAVVAVHQARRPPPARWPALRFRQQIHRSALIRGALRQRNQPPSPERFSGCCLSPLAKSAGRASTLAPIRVAEQKNAIAAWSQSTICRRGKMVPWCRRRNEDQYTGRVLASSLSAGCPPICCSNLPPSFIEPTISWGFLSTIVLHSATSAFDAVGSRGWGRW